MNRLNRLLVNIVSNELKATKHFYTSLFDFVVDYDSEWFIHLISEQNNLELGIIEASNEIVPGNLQATQQGFYLTFVVDSADELYETAKSKGYEVISKPSDTFYGQRRVLLQDPNGMTIDVSSPTQDS